MSLQFIIGNTGNDKRFLLLILFYLYFIFYNNNLPCSNKKLKNTLKKLIYNLTKKINNKLRC